MEIEVKIRLLSREDYDKAEALFRELSNNESGPFKIQKQNNMFFDDIDGNLSKERTVLRIRDNNSGEEYVMTLKANAKMKDGISRVEETEETLPSSIAADIINEPSNITKYGSRSKLINQILTRYPSSHQWRQKGHFNNLRKKFKWNQLIIELDETEFSFCTTFEIEVETTEPENVKHQIEDLLRKEGIKFSDSVKSKFACMLTGSLE